MPKLIKNNNVVSDDWQLIEKEQSFEFDTLTDTQKVLLPLNQYLANKQLYLKHKNIGLWIDSDETTDELQNFCQQLDVIAVNFPIFSDGRGYSLARNLRTYYGYQGELRAIGDVLRDQLFFYQRCGFDAYQVRADTDIEQAIDSLQDFSISYQSAVEETPPLFNQV